MRSGGDARKRYERLPCTSSGRSSWKSGSTSSRFSAGASMFGVGALRATLRVRSMKRPSRVGILEQQAHHVGVDRVERRVEHQVEHRVDRQRRRDGLADLVDRERVLEADVLVLQALAIEPALHDVHDLLDLERLEDVVVGAALHGLDGGLDGAEAGHDDRQDRACSPR